MMKLGEVARQLMVTNNQMEEYLESYVLWVVAMSEDIGQFTYVLPLSKCPQCCDRPPVCSGRGGGLADGAGRPAALPVPAAGLCAAPGPQSAHRRYPRLLLPQVLPDGRARRPDG